MATKPVQLTIEIDDKGVAVLQQTGDEFEDVGKEAKKAGDKTKKSTDKMARGFKKARAGVKKMKDAVFGLKGAIAGVGIALSVAGIFKLATDLIKPNRMIERMTIAFKVLTKDIRIAKARLRELTDFAATTPFELPEVFAAAKLLRVFGIDTNRVLGLVGDAAAGANVPIQELSLWFGRLAAGDFGEALMRFRELGVATKADFEAEGLRFNASGSLVASADEAMGAMLRIVENKFGGMMDEQSKTMNGMISNFSDFVFQAKAKLGEPLFQVFKNAMEEILTQFDKLKNSGKLEAWGEKIGEGAQKAIPFLASVVEFLINEVAPRFQAFFEFLTKELPDKIKGVDFAAIGEDVGSALMRGMKRAVLGGGNDGLNRPAQNLADLSNTIRLGFRFMIKPNQTRSRAFQNRGKPELDAPAVEKAVNTGTLSAYERLFVGRKNPIILDLGDLSKTPAAVEDRVRTDIGQKDFLAQPAFQLPPAPAGIQNLPIDPMGAATRGAELDESINENLQIIMEERRDMYAEMVDDAWNGLEGIKGAFADLAEGTLAVMQNWWVGLADSSQSGKERWEAIIMGMKQTGLKIIGDMVTGWILDRIKQTTMEKIVQATVAATSTAAVAASVAETTAANSLSGAKQSEAAAKIFAAHASIPFAGVGIAAGQIAVMESIMTGVGVISKFASGGLVGGGSGTKDDVPALLTSGEFVLRKDAVDRIGASNLAALNSGSNVGGGTQITIVIDGDNSDERLRDAVQRIIVPELEDLFENNQLSFDGNLFRG